jgi:hypothetical protein
LYLQRIHANYLDFIGVPSEESSDGLTDWIVRGLTSVLNFVSANRNYLSLLYCLVVKRNFGCRLVGLTLRRWVIMRIVFREIKVDRDSVVRRARFKIEIE